MATSGLYGSSPTGATVAAPGSESAGLYGNSTTFGGSYFEWFIFIQSATQPATPTGGSWSFTTNSGTPPAGWSSVPPSSPTLPIWVSIALVNSKNASTLTWTAPGLFAYASGLPILSGSGEPTSGTGLTDQLYIQTGTTPQTIWFKQAGTWTRLTGSTLYVDLTTNQTIAGTKTFSSQIQGSVSGTAANVTGIVDITNGGTGSSTASGARTALGVTATGQDTTYAYRANNLSDLASASTARTNLGLGSAAVLTAGAANGVATLDAGGTVPLSQIPASIQGGVSYQGAWNASTNSPTLTSSVGTKGYYYVVSTAGSTNLNGVTDWNIGDWAIFNGSIWQKIDNTDAVTSVNGFTGTVVLNATDVGAISGITSTDGSVTITSSGTSRDLSVATAAAATNVICQVRNATGATVTKGTVVYISGATGQIPTISKALATSDATSAQTLGMMTADLANNSNGYVTIIGLISNIDTSAYTDGAQLYLSGTTAGAVTATKPYAPIHLVYVAIVEYAHPTQGKLFVKVQNGYELDEIHNVSAQTPSNGQTIVYNSSTGLWTQNTISLTLGVNGVLPTANGGTNLSSFTSGGVVYASSTSALATGSGLTFNGTDTLTVANLVGTRYGLYSEGAGVLFGGNATTNYLRFTVTNAEQMRLTSTGLGIGTSSPAAKLDVVGTGSNVGIKVRSGGNSGINLLDIADTAGAGQMVLNPSGNLGIGTSSAGYKLTVAGTSGSAVVSLIETGVRTWGIRAGGTATNTFDIADFTAGVTRLTIDSTGNVGIGTNSPIYQTQIYGSGQQTAALTDAGNKGGSLLLNTATINAGDGGALLIGAGGSSAKPFAAIKGLLVDGGNNTAGALAFSTRALTTDTALTERMRITSAGNVGIGTSSPARLLDVAGTARIADGSALEWGGVSAAIAGSSSSNTLFFFTTSAERARFDSSGNFLLGTTTNTNTSKLVVNGTISQTVGGTQYLVVDQSDIGTGANEIPLNQYLGNLAYEDNTNLPSVGVGAGTAALPSIFNATDNDTGFWFPAANTLAASTGGSERLRVDSSGNFLLGTTSNSSSFRLRVNATGTALAIFDGAEYAQTIFKGGTQQCYIQNYNSVSVLGTVGATPLTFGTNDVERVRISATGRVSIGTAVADSILTIYSSAATSTTPFANNLLQIRANGGSADGTIQFTDTALYNSYIGAGGGSLYFATNGTTERARIDSSGNLLVGLTSSNNGKISLAVASGGGWFSSKTGASTENLFGSDGSGNASIYTTGGTHTINFYTNGAERARISSAGNFLVGTTSVFSNARVTVSTSATDGIACTQATAGGYCFLSNALTNGGTFYHASFGENGTQRGSITSNGTVTTYNTTSDYRLKNNQAPLTGSGAFIDALQPKTWNWAQDGSKGVGFIAHEFAEVSPSSVTGAKDAIDAEGNPVHQAMQASSAEVIANLVAELQSLRQRVAQLEG